MGTKSEMPQTIAATGRRRPYAAPALRVYGTVRDLTRGSGGSNTDGIMINRRRHLTAT